MSRSIWAAGAALSVLVAASGAFAQEQVPFSSVVVFGDSLSDTGNVATLNNRPDLNSFTTNPGQVTVEVVAEHFGLVLGPSLRGGSNNAYGGAGLVNNSLGTAAGVPTLTIQVNSYLASHPVFDPRALVILYGGGNDVNFAAANLVIGTQTLAQAQTNMSAAGDRAISLINALQAAGAKTVVVVNSPDVGLTPTVRGFEPSFPGAMVAVTGLAKTLNTALDAGLSDRRGIVPVNAFLLMQETVANPAAFGFTNVVDGACTVSSLSCTTATVKAPNADQTWLFADGIHPTTAGHAALAQYILAELAAPQQISLLAETPLAISGVQRSVLDQAMAESTETSFSFTRLSYLTQDFDPQNDITASDGDGAVLVTGGRFPVNQAISVGAAATFGQIATDFGDRGGFDTSSLVGSVFGRAVLGPRAYLAVEAHVGRLSFDDVQRQVDIGQAQRLERGQTDGQVKGAMFQAGYRLAGERVAQGPVASLRYEEVTVDGYEEEGALSTAMTFGRQQRRSLVANLGWQASTQWKSPFGPTTPTLRATYNIEQEDNGRKVEAGLVTMNGVFAMPAFAPSEDWIEVDAGVEFLVRERMRITLGYSGRIGGAQDQHTFGLEMRMDYGD